MAQNQSDTTMDYKAALVNGVGPDPKGGSDAVTSHIRSVPVTVQRKPFLQPEDDVKLSHTGTSSRDGGEGQVEAIHEINRYTCIGTPRANIAATYEHPEGTQEGNWAREHQNQTVCLATISSSKSPD